MVTTPLTKPAPRGPKARKPIARKAKPRIDADALLSLYKAVVPKHVRRPARVRRTPSGRAKESLSVLFGRVIRERDPQCRIGLLDICSGLTTDAAHILGKGRAPSIRWDLRNAVGACRKCHAHYSLKPWAWDIWCLRNIGVGTLTILKTLAQLPKPDRAAARAALIAERNRLRSIRRSN